MWVGTLRLQSLGWWVSKTLEVETRVVVVAGLVVRRLVIRRLVVAMLVVGLVLRSVPATEPARD